MHGPRAPVKKPAAKGATAPAVKGKSSKESIKKPDKKDVKQVQKKRWTKEDDAALKIQRAVRQFLARRRLARKKKEKKEYEELMDKLERDAYVQLAKMEREQAEREQQAKDKERRRKIEEKKRKKRMLEAAFDGDLNEIKNVLKEVEELDNKNEVPQDRVGKAKRERHLLDLIECEDANGNTALSEAASGGDTDTIKFLADRGADPNTVGQFKRTPLYRAAFAGHLGACEMLLQFGADPRLLAEDGQTAEHVASQQGVQTLFKEWDIGETESLLQKLDGEKSKRAEEDQHRREAEKMKLEEVIKIAEQDYQMAQTLLCKARTELENRILEHDHGVEEGFDKPEVTIQVIHNAEAHLEIVKIDVEKAREKLQQARFSLREQEAKHMEEEGIVDDFPGQKVNMKELDDVLIRDVGNKIRDSGKWPLIIDTSGQSSVFLRYRDTNYLNALSPKAMVPDIIRKAVMGAVRYGKPMVLDMMEVNMFDTVAMRFDEIQKGLLNSIMDKSFIEQRLYLQLIRPEDGEEYNKNNFNDYHAEKFKFIILTKNPFPEEHLLGITYPIKVVLSS
ncbi:putative IQ motif and ankyrin repeat domain-containing protein [Lamellibrachia satsuma]|nr:putative IQ motif and ankyrin repeat domain-containing protein [Lamellibrachia satsuma]